MFIEVAILPNIHTKYTKIVSTIKLEWKNETTDMESTILRLIKYKAI